MDSSTPANIIASSKLSRGQRVVAAKVNERWAKKEGVEEYFVFKDFAEEAHAATAPCLDEIATPNNTIKAGTLLGYTGLMEFKGLPPGHTTVHVEVFAPSLDGWLDTSVPNAPKLLPSDWPDFSIVKEEGDSAYDPIIDFNNLSPFFRQIVDAINIDSDTSTLSSEELYRAMQDETLARRLSRLVCFHQSEWWVDSAMEYWGSVLQRLSPQQAELQREIFAQSSWWECLK
jgi:hypothetical protein